MCFFRVVEGGCSKKALRESIKAGKRIDEFLRRRAREEFYEEVKNNENMIERDYYIERLKEEGFTF